MQLQRKLEKNYSLSIKCNKQKKVQNLFNALRFWSKLKEFKETSQGEHRGFPFEKSAQFIISVLLLMVSGLVKIISIIA